MLKIIVTLSTLFFASSIYANSFSLNSTAFNDREKLEPIYTCEGKNISPELEWSHVPKKTKSLTLILSDPDAPGGIFYHWVLFNIPKTVTTLAENITSLPVGAQTGKNSWDKTQYSGPCPPKGSSHRYVFSLYALDTVLELSFATYANPPSGVIATSNGLPPTGIVVITALVVVSITETKPLVVWFVT